MTQSTDDFDAPQATPPEPAPRRKPRIALMGEFSAGKSTLINLMLGRPVVPTRVTATQLPPIWIEAGLPDAWREGVDGSRHPLDPERLEEAPLAGTAFLHLGMEAEVLEVCDLIDTPGISDPNMPAETWQRAAAEADGVIWLTHATQAWRQSEAAVWDQMPDSLRARSLLLVTRIDKLLTESDRARVLARVRRETAGRFRAVLPIALLDALAAGDDGDKWAECGGQAFSDALLEVIGEIERRLRIEGDPRAGQRRNAGQPGTGQGGGHRAAPHPADPRPADPGPADPGRAPGPPASPIAVAPAPQPQPGTPPHPAAAGATARPVLRAVTRPLPPAPPAGSLAQDLRAVLAPEPPPPAPDLRIVSETEAAPDSPAPRRVTPRAVPRPPGDASSRRPL